MKLSDSFILICALSALVSAQAVSQAGEVSVLQGIEQHVGLVLLIASIVMIILMILVIFYLHNISEHLNWIRRIR